MRVRYFQVDAFASGLFRGNPAGVCPLERWLPDDLLQAIAAENNQAETAFFVPEGDRFHLRWFTPEVEIDLCGHATLAAAHVLREELGFKGNVIAFRSQGGDLAVRLKSMEKREGRRFRRECRAWNWIFQRGRGGVFPRLPCWSRDCGAGLERC